MDHAPAASEQPSAVGYRRDIDGLRAVAVVAVLLFHAGLSPFGGGYVGVDVFFVISGFLITSIILAQREAGSFTLANFYERRARRILPALVLVAAVCLPLAWFCLLPPDVVDFSDSLLAVLALGSNLYFWRASGYFDATAELSPLLHTWSLAVEEQYYLFFPALLLLCWRLGRRRLLWGIVAVALISLALAQWASVHRPAANFYWLPTRAWELLFGAACAFHRRDPAGGAGNWRAHVATQVASAAGGLLIAYAIVAFDASTPTPSLHTAIPVLGAVLLLLFAEQTLVGRLLGHRLLVGIGLISYSTYLWHQPLYAYARHLSQEPPSTWLFGGLAVGSMLLGYLSWRWVEVPFRERVRIGRTTFIVWTLCSVICLACFALAGRWSRGFETRLTQDERVIMGFAAYPRAEIYREGVCFLRSEQAYTAFAPVCSVGGAPGAALLWGDSHAAALSFGLRRLMPGLAQYTASGCPPIDASEGVTNRHCPDINRFVLAEIGRTRPERVLLQANWRQYRKQPLAEKIQLTVNAIRGRSPATRITIVGTVPQWYTSLPSSMIRTGLALSDDQFLQSPYDAELQAEDRVLDAAAKALGVAFFSARTALCRQGNCQATTRYDGVLSLTAWDSGHFTAGGSTLLATKLAKTLDR